MDVVPGTIHKILYWSPSGSRGEWTATPDGTKISYVVPAANNNIFGMWRFQAYVVVGGAPYYGKIAQLNVINNIRV